MSKIDVAYSDIINARPEDVYAVLVDYHEGHPAILPKPYFTELTVEAGGTGAGTVFYLLMDVFGTRAAYHMVVTEPEPGRMLVETDMDTGAESTFIVDSLNGGRQSRVTIRSSFNASPGFRGFMERLINPLVTRHIYTKELQQLAAYVCNERIPVNVG